MCHVEKSTHSILHATLEKTSFFYSDDILPHYLNIIIFPELREQNKVTEI